MMYLLILKNQLKIVIINVNVLPNVLNSEIKIDNMIFKYWHGVQFPDFMLHQKSQKITFKVKK